MQAPASRHPISTVLVFMTQTRDLLRHHVFSFQRSIGVSQRREAPSSAGKNGTGLPTGHLGILTKSGERDYKRLRT